MEKRNSFVLNKIISLTINLSVKDYLMLDETVKETSRIVRGKGAILIITVGLF